MTKILITDDKIIFKGHSKTKEKCGVITNVVNTLAKSNNFKEIKNENGYAEFESLKNDELKFPPMRQYSFYNHDGTQMYFSDGTYDPGNETIFTLQNANTIYGIDSRGSGNMNKTDQSGTPLNNDIIISDDLTTATFPFIIAGIATSVNGDIVYSVGDSWTVSDFGETKYYIVEGISDNLQTKTIKLINYAKSQLSSKGVTSTATTLRGMLDDIDKIHQGEAMPLNFNITYSTEEPEDTSKVWISAAAPTKTIIDNAAPSNIENMSVNYTSAFASTKQMLYHIEDGKRILVSSTPDTRGYRITCRIYEKDSNEYTDYKTVISASYDSSHPDLRTAYYCNNKVFFACDINEGWDYIYIKLWDLATGTIGSVSRTQFLYSRPTYLFEDGSYYYTGGDSSGTSYYTTFNYVNTAGTRTQLYRFYNSDGKSDKTYMMDRSFLYNGKLIFFTSTTNKRLYNITTNELENELINIEVTDYSRFYQDDNKLYYHIAQNDTSYLKYFDLSNNTTVVVKELSGITENLYVGKYDDNTLLLSGVVAPSYKLKFYYNVLSDEIVLNLDKSDYQLTNSTDFGVKGKPIGAFLGNSSNIGEEVNIYNYDTELNRWMFSDNRKLPTPTFKISTNTLTISTIENATSYEIYSNGELLTSTTSTTVDLSTLLTTAGTYKIKVKAISNGAYRESKFSSESSYTVS